MSAEMFSKLKELDSLSKMRIKHLAAKSEQDDRLSKLTGRQNDALLIIEKLKQENQIHKDALFEVEKKIKTLQQQKERLMEIAEPEERIAVFNAQIDEREEKGLLLIEAIEKNEAEINDQKQFLIGLAKTMEEISQEAQEISATEQKAVENLDLRISLLEEELSPDFRHLYQKVRAKNLSNGPFTRIETGSCYLCRYKLSRLEESEIDTQQKLKQCSQCSRIFLPYGS